ncbi:hypothetical protein BDZ97DRAFT_1921201 [Flammula alnicola]|nr:hypothetical protein BDZ97DRAFT_1921201 [Flammula alnicola]
MNQIKHSPQYDLYFLVETQIMLKAPRDEPVAINVVEFPLQPLLSVLRTAYADEEDTFEQILAPLLEEFRQARSTQEAMLTEVNEEVCVQIAAPTLNSHLFAYHRDIGSDILGIQRSPHSSNKLALKETLSTSEAILSRKLKLERERNRASIAATKSDSRDAPLTSLPPVPPDLPINPEVLDALYSIKTTPFSNSFLSRLHGTKQRVPPGLLAVDWETRTPWMNLMTDIHDHYTFAHLRGNARWKNQLRSPTRLLIQISYHRSMNFWKGRSGQESMPNSGFSNSVATAECADVTLVMLG